MAAGHGGAGADPSFGLAIRLPFEQKTNPFIENDPKLINFKYFFTRKLMFVRSSHAIALFPGGFGTMDEGFEVLTLVQTGKAVPMPIVFIDSPGGDFWQGWRSYVENHLLARGLISTNDLRLYKITDNVDAAVHEVRHFYSNFHSVRYARDEIIIRLHRRPTDAQLAEISEKISDIKTKRDFRLSDALPLERDEEAASSTPDCGRGGLVDACGGADGTVGDAGGEADAPAGAIHAGARNASRTSEAAKGVPAADRPASAPVPVLTKNSIRNFRT